MTGKPSYSPAEILGMGRRAEFEGNLDYATQFYTYLIESLPGTREANDAMIGMERVNQLRDKASSSQTFRQAAPASPEPQVPQATPPLTQGQQAPPHTYDKVPRSAPPSPRPPINRGAKPAAALQGGPQQRQEPALSVPPSPHRPDATTTSPPQSPPSAHPSHQRGAPPQQAHWNPVSVADAHTDDNTPLPRVMQTADETESMDEVEFVPGYRVGRFLAFAMILFGWLALIGGIAFAGLAIAGMAGAQPLAEYAGLPVGILIGAAALLGGLVMVFLGTLAQAAFEAANNTRELLDIERARDGW